MLATRLTTWSLRCGQHRRHLVGVGQQVAQLRRRARLSVWENRATPCTASLQIRWGVWKVLASVASESDSWSVSSPLMVVVRSPSASGS